MPKCQCGKRKATLAYNRILRFFPYQRRVLCDECFEDIQRREDMFFFAILFTAFFMVIGSIVLIHYVHTKRAEEASQEINQYYEENDLDRDGRVTLWEESATAEQKENLRTLGYPWKSTGASKRIQFVVERDTFIELTKQEGFWKFFYFPDMMEAYFNRITQPDSKVQFMRALVTVDSDIAFVVTEFESPPPPGFALSDIEKKKLSFDDKTMPQIIHTIVGLEPKSSSRIREMLKINDEDYHVQGATLTKGPKPKAGKGKK